MLLSISADLRAADDAIAFEGPIDPTMPFNNFTSGAGALGTSPPTGRGPSETGVASVAIKQLTMTKKYWYVCATHTGPSSSLQRDDGAGASLMLKLMLVLMFTSPTAHPPPRTSHRAHTGQHPTPDNTRFKPKFTRDKACVYIARAGGWVVRQNSKGGLALTVCKVDPHTPGTAGVDRFYHTLIERVPGKKKVPDTWYFANADTDLRFTTIEQLMADGVTNALEYFSTVMEM